jgi:hypothetical protein
MVTVALEAIDMNRHSATGLLLAAGMALMGCETVSSRVLEKMPKAMNYEKKPRSASRFPQAARL